MRPVVSGKAILFGGVALDKAFEEIFGGTPEKTSSIRWVHYTGAEAQATIRDRLQQEHFSVGLLSDHERGIHRAEFDDAGHYYMIRIYGLSWDADKRRVRTHPVYVWVRKDLILTWTPDRLPEVLAAQQKLHENREWVKSTARVAYYLLDEILGGLFPLLDRVNDQIAGVEQRAMSGRPGVEDEIFSLKRGILRLRHILASMRDAISQVVRLWTTTLADETFYYTELYDHVIRLFDTVDTYRELTNSVLDIYLSFTSNRLNEIVKTLTLVTTILLPASLVAAIYGMNFDYLPFSHVHIGFYLILALIACISLGLLWVFRRRRWL